MKARLFIAAALTTACAAAFSASAGARGTTTHSGYFRLPSGAVYCDYLYGGVAKYTYVRCGYSKPLTPQEPKPAGGCPKGTDYVGNRMILMEKGRGKLQPCAGDAGPFGNPGAAKALAYGHTWHGGPFSCTAALKGMTCKRTDGHGFHLVKHGWRVF